MRTALVVSLLLAPAALLPARAQAPRETTPLAVDNPLHRQERFGEALEALRAAAALAPTLAEPQHRIAVLLWEKVRADATMDAATKASYIQEAIDSEDRALALQPDYLVAFAYKSLFLRFQANASTDPLEQQRLTEEADTLRSRALAIPRDRETAAPRPADAAAGGVAPNARSAEPFEASMARLQPLLVGRTVKTPAKLKNAAPVYPPIAQSARIQGLVMLEALIDDAGNVANANVLRSIPLLDLAALDAVSKWKFVPVEAEGHPVAVTMIVTVGFRLQ